jgi:hypothetical protein
MARRPLTSKILDHAAVTVEEHDWLAGAAIDIV